MGKNTITVEGFEFDEDTKIIDKLEFTSVVVVPPTPEDLLKGIHGKVHVFGTCTYKPFPVKKGKNKDEVSYV